MMMNQFTANASAHQSAYQPQPYVMAASTHALQQPQQQDHLPLMTTVVPAAPGFAPQSATSHQPVYYLANAPQTFHQQAGASSLGYAQAAHASYCVAPTSPLAPGQPSTMQGLPPSTFIQVSQPTQIANYPPVALQAQQQHSQTMSPLAPTVAYNLATQPQWSTEATSMEHQVQPKMAGQQMPLYFYQQPVFQQTPPPAPSATPFGNDAPILSWKQKKQVFGRSDRLRRLAAELTRKDQHAINHAQSSRIDYYGLIEKDNTSASETSKSHQGQEKQTRSNNHFRASQAQQAYNAEDAREDDYLENPNQTVSELLSMLSGSAESAALKDEESKAPQAPQAQNQANSNREIISRANANLKNTKQEMMPANEFLIREDQAIQEIKGYATMPGKHQQQVGGKPTAAEDDFIDRFNRGEPASQQSASQPKYKAKQPRSQPLAQAQLAFQPGQQRPLTKQKKHKQDSPVILAEDEATDKMVYYDKSSCMHAPKATLVPIL